MFKTALKEHNNPERLTRTAAFAVRKRPKLSL